MFLLRNDVMAMISLLFHLFYGYLSKAMIDKRVIKLIRRNGLETFTHFMSRSECIYQDVLTQEPSTQMLSTKPTILEQKSVKNLL